MNVESRAHRILIRMVRYHKINIKDEVHKLYPIDLDLDENTIGVFENIPNHVEKSIVITDKGIHYCFNKNKSQKIKYTDIVNLSYPNPEEKHSKEILTLYLKNDESFPLLIKRTAEDQKFNDLFGFMTFIDRVRTDIKRIG